MELMPVQDAQEGNTAPCPQEWHRSHQIPYYLDLSPIQKLRSRFIDTNRRVASPQLHRLRTIRSPTQPCSPTRPLSTSPDMMILLGKYVANASHPAL